jgi:hypothetical protein
LFVFIEHLSQNPFENTRKITGTWDTLRPTSPQRDRLIRYINSAAIARQEATVRQTKTKRVTAWRCWNAFLISVGFAESFFLDGMSKFQRNIIISSFAQAVREATFSPQNQETLVEGTVNDTVTFVAHAFRTNSSEDPRLDADSKTCFLLEEQYRGYGNQDKARAKQKSLPASVLRRMFEWSSSPWEMAVTWLLVLAFFFAMRSCEVPKIMVIIVNVAMTLSQNLLQIVFSIYSKIKQSCQIEPSS